MARCSSPTGHSATLSRAGQAWTRRSRPPLAGWCEFHRHIAGLPADEREVVGLLFYQELTQSEAAAVLDVTVRTGDYVLGDRDGVVLVPQEVAEEAVSRTEAVMNTESEMRRAILGGMDPVEAYKTYGKF